MRHPFSTSYHHFGSSAGGRAPWMLSFGTIWECPGPLCVFMANADTVYVFSLQEDDPVSAGLVQLLQHEKNKVRLPHGDHSTHSLVIASCLSQFDISRVEAMVMY